jgi:hypothetical protein
MADLRKIKEGCQDAIMELTGNIIVYTQHTGTIYTEMCMNMHNWSNRSIATCVWTCTRTPAVCSDADLGR